MKKEKSKITKKDLPKIILIVLVIFVIILAISLIISFGFCNEAPIKARVYIFTILSYLTWPICEIILLARYKLPKPLFAFLLFHLILCIIALPSAFASIILKWI